MVKVRGHLWCVRGDRRYVPSAEKICDEARCVLRQWLLRSTRKRYFLGAKDLLARHVEELPDVLDAGSFGLIVGAGDEIFDFFFVGLEGRMNVFNIETSCALELRKH